MKPGICPYCGDNKIYCVDEAPPIMSFANDITDEQEIELTQTHKLWYYACDCCDTTFGIFVDYYNEEM